MSNRGGNETKAELNTLIWNEAFRLGFAHCGVARNDSLEDTRPFYSAFIGQKGHASLDYLKYNLEKRLHPELVLEGTKSVIALLMNYYPSEIIPEKNNFIISKYAYGDDYHKIMRDRIRELTGFIIRTGGNCRAKGFSDSGVLAEKCWAQKCGVGWQGKNTLIINKASGSFFFIGIILTDLELEPDTPGTNHCGTCSKCITACPTGALNTPYQLDIPRCISYLTIESRERVPDDLKSKLTDRIYGCDICQDVCPYNRFASANPSPVYRASESLKKMRKKDWLALTEPDFNRIFSISPVKRVGYKRLMSNILAAADQ